MVYNSNPNSSYQAGKLFNDHISKYSNQNTILNTITYQYEEVYQNQVTSKSDQAEARILGQGSDFTAFTIVETSESDGTWTKMATILSGTKTSNGIKDYYRGILMLEKNDPNNKKMGIGEFRIFKDDDGLSEPTTWQARQRAATQKGNNLKIQSLPSCIDEGPTTCRSEEAIE
jgi:hypothetical protein